MIEYIAILGVDILEEEVVLETLAGAVAQVRVRVEHFLQQIHGYEINGRKEITFRGNGDVDFFEIVTNVGSRVLVHNFFGVVSEKRGAPGQSALIEYSK